MQSPPVGTPALTQYSAIERSQRENLFKEKINLAKTRLNRKFFNLIERENDPREFMLKNDPVPALKEISTLDHRIKVIFSKVLSSAYLEIKQEKPAFPSMAAVLGATCGHVRAMDWVFKSTALPIVKRLVVDLDRNFPGLIDEEISKNMQIEQPADSFFN